MQFLSAWTLVSLLSAIASWRIARRRSLPAGAFFLMALLLGPGAIPLALRAKPCPQLAQSLALIALLGALSTTLFLLSHTVFLKYADRLGSLSLALPIPTSVLLTVIYAFESGSLGNTWILVSLVFPVSLFRLTNAWLSCDGLEQDEVVLRLLGNWARILPVMAFVTAFLSFLAFALLEPVRQLAGPVGG